MESQFFNNQSPIVQDKQLNHELIEQQTNLREALITVAEATDQNESSIIAIKVMQAKLARIVITGQILTALGFLLALLSYFHAQ